MRATEFGMQIAKLNSTLENIRENVSQHCAQILISIVSLALFSWETL